MTAFDLGMTEKEIDGADGVDVVNRRLIGALITRMKDNAMTKSKLAEKLGVHRSQITKWLSGNQNLTARTIGEILGALDYGFDIELKDRRQENGVHEKAVSMLAPVIVRSSSSQAAQAIAPRASVRQISTSNQVSFFVSAMNISEAHEKRAGGQ